MKLTATLILLLMALEWRKIALSDIRHALKGNIAFTTSRLPNKAPRISAACSQHGRTFAAWQHKPRNSIFCHATP